MSQIQILDWGPSKPVGFKVPKKLWDLFKSEVYKHGLEISDTLETMIELFVTNKEFQGMIIKKAREK